MCGRYNLRTPTSVLARQFSLLEPPALPPRYNIAPTQQAPIIRQMGDERRLALVRWGLVPPWADDLAIGNRLINARSETAASKPAFRKAFRRRRCLLPADGFYEWMKLGRTKVPYHITLAGGEPFAMAGLWERWDGPDGPIDSCTILTCAANELIEPLHDRMPVILPPEAHSVWLDEGVGEPERLEPLLVPLPSSEMTMHPIGERINSPANDDASLLEPVDDRAGPQQRTLFDE